jgi:hypothetical protein
VHGQRFDGTRGWITNTIATEAQSNANSNRISQPTCKDTNGDAKQPNSKHAHQSNKSLADWRVVGNGYLWVECI